MLGIDRQQINQGGAGKSFMLREILGNMEEYIK